MSTTATEPARGIRPVRVANTGEWRTFASAGRVVGVPAAAIANLVAEGRLPVRTLPGAPPMVSIAQARKVLDDLTTTVSAPPLANTSA